MTKKVYYTNEEISDMLRELIRQIVADGYQPDCVVGLSRGGLDIGIKMSHFFGVPFEPLKWQTRNGDFQDRANLNRIMTQYHRVLIIDDILDSGISLNGIYQEIKNANNHNYGDYRLAVLIENIDVENTVQPNYAASEISKFEDAIWVIFPWENWWCPSLR